MLAEQTYLGIPRACITWPRVHYMYGLVVNQSCINERGRYIVTRHIASGLLAVIDSTAIVSGRAAPRWTPIDVFHKTTVRHYVTFSIKKKAATS